MNKNLTKIDHSYKSIFKITIPLILVSLSSYLMMTIDRILLTTVSTDMMNAVSIVSNFIVIFIFFFSEIIEKSGIFIGQLNGEKQYEKMSKCVWQMLFLTAFISPISFLFSYFSDTLNILSPNLLQYGIGYQKIILCFSPLNFIYAALSAFFIGQGKTYIISMSVFIGCVFNFFVSLVFIKYFNLGTTGAAYGTGIAYFTQIIFLFSIFFKKKNRTIFKTTHISFDFSLLKKIFKIGLPTGMLVSSSMIIWLIILKFVSDISNDQLTLYNLVVIVNYFFSFTSTAIKHSVSTISANLITKGNLKGIKILVKRFMAIVCAFLSMSLFLLLIFQKPLIAGITSLDTHFINSQDFIKFSIFSIIVFGAMEMTYCILQGICISGGDTKFVSIFNIFIVLFVDFIPICLLKYFGCLTSILPILLVFIFEPIPMIIVYFIRYRSLKWYKKLL